MFQNFQTVVDELSVATIVLENNPWHDDISQSLECKILSFQLLTIQFPSDYGFSAYENSLNLQREYYQEFACEFDLLYYPFDTQASLISKHVLNLLIIGLPHGLCFARLHEGVHSNGGRWNWR